MQHCSSQVEAVWPELWESRRGKKANIKEERKRKEEGKEYKKMWETKRTLAVCDKHPCLSFQGHCDGNYCPAARGLSPFQACGVRPGGPRSTYWWGSCEKVLGLQTEGRSPKQDQIITALQLLRVGTENWISFFFFETKMQILLIWT